MDRSKAYRFCLKHIQQTNQKGMKMTELLKQAQQHKLKEVQEQQAKLKSLETDLAKLKTKVTNHEELTSEDTSFISNLGWLSALSVTVATVAASM